MKKINLAVIADNYGKNFDGIGAYAANIAGKFSDDISVRVYTAVCSGDDGKLKKMTTPGMTKAVLKAGREIKNKDGVLIEYPFKEWNPMIVPAFRILYKKCRKNDTKVFLSLHEYARVNVLRRLIIKALIRISDVIFVSSEEMKRDISSFGRKTYLRDIPTNIYSDTQPVDKDRNKFVFFGLINKAKAVKEMLEGWDEFNKDGKYSLDILTSSTYEDNIKHNNVEYYHKLPDEEIMKKMKEASFSILPIIPEVDMKNATFKTSALASLVSVGKFCSEYKELPFVHNMESYIPEEFTKAFNSVVSINENELEEMRKEALMFGSKYTPEAVSRKIEREIKNEIRGGEK